MASSHPGRFLPGDPRVEEPYRLTPQTALRVAVLGFLALTVFAVLFLRLWALQVLSGDRYLSVANDNRVRTIRLEAPRGPIVDRNGRVLVGNVAGTRVELWPADLPRTWPARRKELRALADVTGATVKEMLAQLNAHGDDPLTPVVVQRGLRRDQIDYLSEHSAAVPRRAAAGQLPAQLPVPLARRAGDRLRRCDLPGAVQGAQEEGLPANRLDRPGRRRVDATTRTCAARTARRS